MKFQVHCEIDGPIEVGIEDVQSVVLHGSDMAFARFRCPICGSGIDAMVKVPPFLGDVIRSLLDAPEDAPSVLGLTALDSASGSGEDIDSRVELFRRQLDNVETVDDILAEIDRTQHGDR